MKKDTLSKFLQDQIELSVTIYIAQILIKKIWIEQQKKYITIIDIDDLAGIREQEIAHERGYV